MNKAGRFRSDFAYRGLSNKDYALETSLNRLGRKPEKLEKHLIMNFRKYAHSVLDKRDSFWTVLALAQHHGVPTRLMDWTFSPYVALHFSCESTDKFNKDGIIWCVDFKKIHGLLSDPFKWELKAYDTRGYSVEMLDRVCKNLEEFDAHRTDDDFVLFFEPPSTNQRIINQFALFSMMSSPIARLDLWLKRHPDYYKTIIIPKELKWEIRDKLDQVNITERVLFPGLDGLGAWLNRYYGPGPSVK